MCINPFFYHKILEIFDEYFSSLESYFSMIHSNLLSFKRSFLSSTKIATSTISGYRIDRIIVAETLKQLAGYTITLRFTYKTYQNSYEYKADYKFDCVKKGKKSIWLHRDESRVHGESNLKAYTSQIFNVSACDYIEFGINWYNLFGLTKIETIKWQTPIIQSTKLILNDLKTLQGNMNKIHLFTSRYCEAEIAQTYWYLPEYYSKPGQIFVFDLFEPFLKMKKLEMAGTDITVCKITFLAVKSGIVPNSSNRLGILLEIKEPSGEVVCEIKRMGLLYDRHKSLQIRVGDTIILYVSR